MCIFASTAIPKNTPHTPPLQPQPHPLTPLSPQVAKDPSDQKVVVVSAMGSCAESPIKVTDLLLNMIAKAARQDAAFLVDLAALQVSETHTYRGGRGRGGSSSCFGAGVPAAAAASTEGEAQQHSSSMCIHQVRLCRGAVEISLPMADVI